MHFSQSMLLFHNKKEQHHCNITLLPLIVLSTKMVEIFTQDFKSL